MLLVHWKGLGQDFTLLNLRKKIVNDGNGKVIYFQISIAMIALVKIPQIPFYMHPVRLLLTYKWKDYVRASV